MQIIPICLSCAKPDMEDRACTAYPREIPWRILHGAGCDYFEQNPGPAPHAGTPLEPKPPEKSPI